MIYICRLKKAFDTLVHKVDTKNYLFLWYTRYILSQNNTFSQVKYTKCDE